jgi:hypothetical protein
MTTTAGHSFYIGPIVFFYNQVNDTGSSEPLVIKQMSLFVVGGGKGRGSTYIFMFYVNVRRLNNSVVTRFMRTHAFFFFVSNAVVLSRVFRGHWSVLTRIVLTGNYKKKFFSHFPFSLVQ